MAFYPTDISLAEDVLELVADLVKTGEHSRRRFDLVAERNELWAAGEQFTDINGSSQTIVDIDWSKDTPKVSQNHLRNLVNTYKARITQDRPDATAWPTSNRPESVASADTARKFIDYFGKEIQVDIQVDECVRLGTLHGVAGFKICFNPASDQVEWQPVSLFDFIVDPAAKSYRDAQWIIFKTNIDPYQAKAEMQAAGIDDEPPVGLYKQNGQIDIDGTEVVELWHRPGPRLPKGLFAKTIGGHVLDSRPFPYVFQNLENPQGKPDAVLPLVYFKVDAKRGTPYADTWLSDVIGEQRLVNENEAMLLRIKRETAMVKMVVQDKATVQALSNNSQVIVSPGGISGVGFVPPPQINSLLFADRDYHFKKMYDLAGLNEQLVGVENIKSGTSAKHMAYLNELDGMKHKGTTQSLEMCLLDAWKLTLQLAQHYYLDERLMRISSDDGFDTQAFRMAEIQGITVDLQPRPGLSRMAASKVAQAEEDVVAGIRQPGTLDEVRDTGQLESAAVSNTRRLVRLEVSQILRGAQPQVDPNLIAPVAAQEVQQLIGLLMSQGVVPELLQAVQAYGEAYKQLSQQQQAGQQPPAGKGKPAPKGPSVGPEEKQNKAMLMASEGKQVSGGI